MKIRGASVKVVALLCAGLCVLAASAALLGLSRSPPVRVKVLDPNFRVLDVKVLRGRRHSFYLGNQTEGRIRDYLAQRLHLPVKPLTDIGTTAYNLTCNSARQSGPFSAPRGGPSEPRSSVLVISYSFEGVQSPIPPGQFTPALSADLDAEFRDSSGAVIPLGMSVFSGTKPYWQSFNLDSARTNAGNYKLRLMHARTCVAELEIENLPAPSHKPYHIGANAF
jgi:hypothetical protein